MPPTAATTSADLKTAPLSDRWKTRSFAYWAFLAALYVQLAFALMPTWSDGTYYDYGYLVPFLLPYFFLIRWKENGLDEPSQEERLRRISLSIPAGVLVFVGILLITLFRLTQWADSGWRTPLYFHAFTVLAITFATLIFFQGKKVFSYWACAVLVLLAVPLPSNLEYSLIHNLTRGVLEFALFVNRMLGLPLQSSGETIFANGIPLQVSDGCSGIRSFQSGIFAGFVLGEYLRLSLPSRLGLLVSGLGLAFLMNGGRVIYLVRHAVAHPDADIQRVHDLTGYVSLTLTFLSIAGVGYLIAGLEATLKKRFNAVTP